MDSPYRIHLNTNYIPSDAETTSIKQFLTGPLAKLSALDDEISRRQVALNKLRLEQSTLKDFVGAHQALVSPVRRLPIDVLQEIFVHCLPIKHNAVMSVKEAPILLGRICSSWRSVALSVPRLWASLHIPVPTPNVSPFNPDRSAQLEQAQNKILVRTAAVCEWLKRSGACPLTISFNQADFMADSDGRQYSEPLIKALMSSSRRWKKMDFFAPSSALALITTLTPDDVPLLEALRIDCKPCIMWPGELLRGELCWPKNAIFRASRLRRISLLHMKEQLLSLPIRWSQLTELSLIGRCKEVGEDFGPISVSHVLSLFRSCPSLLAFMVVIDKKEDPGSNDDYQVITHGALESLTVTGIHVNMTGLLNCLNLPSLRHIGYQEMTAPRTIESTPNISLLSLLTRSGEMIETLTLETGSFNTAEIIKCLELTPSLTRLLIKDSSYFDGRQAPCGAFYWSRVFNDTVMDRLTPSDANLGRCLCPKLEVFECDVGVAFSEAKLLRFIQGRKTPQVQNVGKLRRVRVVFDNGDRDSDVWNELSSYVGEGLDIELHSPPCSSRGMFSPWDGLPSKDVIFVPHF